MPAKRRTALGPTASEQPFAEIHPPYPGRDVRDAFCGHVAHVLCVAY
jgi:hypothetical protein